MFSGSLDRETLFVEEPFDFQDQFDIFAAVLPLIGSGFLRTQAAKLRFPIAQDIGFDAGKAGHFPDFEIELVGDIRW